MQGIYDVLVVAIVVLILTAFVFTWRIDSDQRYIINLEYYSLETLLNSDMNGEKVYDAIMERHLDKNLIEEKLDKIVPNGYYYLFEIPEYNFRATNFRGGDNIYNCVKIDKIYPINYNFNGVHLIFGIWNKKQKFRVVPCEG